VSHHARSGMRLLLAAATLLVLATGCATVAPYQRERLVDPIMSFQAEAKKDARRVKTLDAREGSTGGTGGAGGGCACN
jgi:Domain of unknown function (DUF4266)